MDSEQRWRLAELIYRLCLVGSIGSVIVMGFIALFRKIGADQ